MNVENAYGMYSSDYKLQDPSDLRLLRHALFQFRKDRKIRDQLRVFLERRRAAFDAYLNTHAVRKLQIGSEGMELADWLNTDLKPRPPGVFYMNAVEPFPFPDRTFDYIFSEHMIEHVPYSDGQKMLAECHRVLKDGGKIRIATPNLANLIRTYVEPANDQVRDYLEWQVSFSKLPESANRSCHVLNLFARAWGHQFVYDAETLSVALGTQGFRHLEQFAVGVSDDPVLQGLEKHGTGIGEQWNEFETLIVQGVKGQQPVKNGKA